MQGRLSKANRFSKNLIFQILNKMEMDETIVNNDTWTEMDIDYLHVNISDDNYTCIWSDNVSDTCLTEDLEESDYLYKVRSNIIS